MLDVIKTDFLRLQIQGSFTVHLVYMCTDYVFKVFLRAISIEVFTTRKLPDLSDHNVILEKAQSLNFKESDYLSLPTAAGINLLPRPETYKISV